MTAGGCMTWHEIHDLIHGLLACWGCHIVPPGAEQKMDSAEGSGLRWLQIHHPGHLGPTVVSIFDGISAHLFQRDAWWHSLVALVALVGGRAHGSVGHALGTALRYGGLLEAFKYALEAWQGPGDLVVEADPAITALTTDEPSRAGEPTGDVKALDAFYMLAAMFLYSVLAARVL
eukprot:Skav219581  [mRNA]  locus=scaffold249:219233:220161:+ [translate_table: standard]